MIFLILVGADAGIVEEIEESRKSCCSLHEWSQARVLGKTVLMVPAPVCSEMYFNVTFIKEKRKKMRLCLPGHTSSPSNRIVELSTSKPSWKLINLDLTKEKIIDN